MKTINLLNSDKSDIKYRIDQFPDGEKSIVVLDELDHKIDGVKIITRLASMDDIFIALQICDILDRHEIVYDMYISYLMSMRMDRVMSWNRPYSLKVVTNMIKSCGARKMYVLEAHSDKTLTLLNAEPWKCYFDSAKNQIFANYVWDNAKLVVFPDAGACERYANTTHIVATFKKVRDLETGNIKSLEPTTAEDVQLIKDRNDILIVDDLCDGGGTFVGIAKRIKEINPNAKLSIIVTHMVNPRGIENLSKNFDSVTFSNSYKDWDNLPDNVEMIELQ